MFIFDQVGAIPSKREVTTGQMSCLMAASENYCTTAGSPYLYRIICMGEYFSYLPDVGRAQLDSFVAV